MNGGQPKFRLSRSGSTWTPWIGLALVGLSTGALIVGIASNRAALARELPHAVTGALVSSAGTATAPVAPPDVASPAAGVAATVQASLTSRSVTPYVAGGPPLTLSTTVIPNRICAYGANTCPSGYPSARVTIQAAAEVNPTPYWPDVQVAFVIETTAYDGVYYHYFGYPGTDPCALSNNRQGLPCEESNGVPFFIQNAGSIAGAIQSANPHSHVSFAMVDFFGTDCGDWNDCGDSEKYHVDIPSFVPASAFGSAVTESFKDGVFAGGFAGIVGLDDNFLHSPSITALYGAIIGSGLDWSANTHHVVVLIGSAAPRDPSYNENYYVSSFDSCCSGSQALGWTCEPSYNFGTGSSPNCEGWVRSQDGNPNDSIAGLARSSPTCTDSIGHVCTVDVVSLWATSTDPLSMGWPKHPSYNPGTATGPGAPRVVMNTNHVLAAACDLAAATGGSWAGPTYWTCPNGNAGTLSYVPHGSYTNPNTNNPSLFAALRQISFGPVYQTLVANGTKAPMFQYIPIGGIRIAPQADFVTSCDTPTSTLSTCQHQPTNLTTAGVRYWGWNWSTDPKQNAMYVGDVWTTSFNIIDAGPPYDVNVAVLACITNDCRAAGSGTVGGLYTAATYRPAGNTSAANITYVQSFPLGVVKALLGPAANLPPPTPPPIPSAPPGIPVPATTPLPITQTIGIGNNVGIANVSLQGIAAGLLGSGFIRVATRNRPIANPVLAAKTKTVRSKFDGGMTEGGTHVGKFE